MRVSAGIQEGGIEVGNHFDKYGSKNPIVRWMMSGFSRSLTDLVKRADPTSIHEIGCGEGYWVNTWCQEGLLVRGCDFSEKVIEIARENAKNSGVDPALFSQKSIYDLDPETDSADLMVCCEVMEHLQEPHKGLEALQRVATNAVILSVPREPIWCALNMARGKYISSFGNTPGHIQHWSQSGFVRLVSEYFNVKEVRAPFPWTMLLAQKK